MLFSVILTGCSFSEISKSFIPTSGDYKILLTSNYYIVRINSKSIEIKGGLEDRRVPDDRIDDYSTKRCKISMVGCNEDFIVARQDMYVDQKYDNNEGYYWIIDVNTDTDYGPFNYDEYLEKREELGISDSLELKRLDEYKKDYSINTKKPPTEGFSCCENISRFLCSELHYNSPNNCRHYSH